MRGRYVLKAMEQMQVTKPAATKPPAMKVKKSVSRCAAVAKGETIQQNRHTIGGLFATVSMRRGPAGHGNQILQLAEMKNSECKQFEKIQLLNKLIQRKTTASGKKVRVGKYCHDCACTLEKELKGTLCETLHLDAYHGSKHQCTTPLIKRETYHDLNSLAAEQLWNVMEGL